MKERSAEHCVWLSADEAIGLLELVMLSPGELTPEQRAAVLKLSECCRRSLMDHEPLPQGGGREAAKGVSAASGCRA